MQPRKHEDTKTKMVFFVFSCLRGCISNTPRRSSSMQNRGTAALRSLRPTDTPHRPARARLRRARSAHVVASLENGDGLIDDVVLVRLQVLGPPLLDQLDHPAGIEVDAEADAAAQLREVLDRQPQAPGTRRSEHEPVGALREV